LRMNVLFELLLENECAVWTVIWEWMCCLNCYLRMTAVWTVTWEWMCCLNCYLRMNVLFELLLENDCAVWTVT